MPGPTPSSGETSSSPRLERLLENVRSCDHCRQNPSGPPLPHPPRPVLVASPVAKICIIGQAPGTRVHASGKPFTDPSGNRLRDWLGVSAEQFYDSRNFAIIPMGFCFPGLNDKGADLPPRKECAEKWHEELFELMPQIRLKLLIGMYAQRRYLGKRRKKTLSETVRCWRDYIEEEGRAVELPLPHPSWRNNAWLRKNPFFEHDVVPFLRTEIKTLLGS